MRCYIFVREQGWYPLELKDSAEAIANAECNEGTLLVEDVETGEIIWRKAQR